MRKFIISNFALDCWVRLFGKTYNFTRASRIIFPLFCACGLTDGIVFTILLFFTAIALFFGFVYFRIKPLKNEDWVCFSDTQKYQYAIKMSLNDWQKLELKEVEQRLKTRYENI